MAQAKADPRKDEKKLLERKCWLDIYRERLRKTAFYGGLTTKTGTPLLAGKSNRVPGGRNIYKHSWNKWMMMKLIVYLC